MAESKFTPAEFELSATNILRRVQTPALGIGGLALAASLAGALVWPEAFYRAWLVAFLYWLAMSLGCTAILMMQYISGGRWGAAIRRPLEAGAANVPMMALFFVPIVLGIPYLYPWADPDLVAQSAQLQWKAPYLNTQMFTLRAVIYFAIWSALSMCLVSWSRQEEAEGYSEARAGRVSVLSHAGIIVWLLSMSLAGIDWAMSIEPMWFSHIYGLMFAGGQILTALTLAIQVSARIADHRPVSSVLSPDRFHDLGKLLLAFVMVWTYFQLSQYIIMWGANLPEEVDWYLVRNAGGWEFLTIGLFLLHFVLPFGLLLSRNRKKKPMSIAAVATLVCVMRYVDIYWWITPSFSPEGFYVHPMHLTTLLGIGGIWSWRYIGNLASRPILSVHDPIVATELEHA
ncbi:MAG: hypothetical protein ABR538_04030 [Candidatus Binatia bacterium]